jgi:peptidoglycan/LPS O-acetylase OafA/YrhL
MSQSQAKVIEKKSFLHPKYRPDIDGLRAVAVLSVLAFHAFPAWFKSGFIGVDIFFVISGFLISSIIFENLSKNQFSFFEFYARRVKRIFPALSIVLISSLIVGWFVLLADEYQQLGQHVAAGAGFISNFVLWSESGYFDSAAELKPLLHLWSLGIEEQFYIVWPLLIFIAWHLRLNLLLIILLAAFASFVFNLFQIASNPIATFYSPFTRCWELLIGAFLGYLTVFSPHRLIPIGKYSNGLSLLGFVLLILGFLLLDKTSAFPGAWALLPSLGAAFIICTGPQAKLNQMVLSNKLLVWVGLISFPLYLWHWPLLSFAHIIEGEMPSRIVRIGALCTSLLLAYFTYQFVEKPIRSHQKTGKKMFCLLVLMILIGCTGYICHQKNGLDGFGYRTQDRSEFAKYFENSLPDWKYYQSIKRYENYRQDCDFYDVDAYRAGHATQVPRVKISPSCYQKNPNKRKFLFIWGDSHAQQTYFGLEKNLPSDWQVLIVASSACAPNPFVSEDSLTDYCQRSNWFALNTIKQIKPDVLLVAQSKNHRFVQMQQIENVTKRLGAKRTLFLGPVLHWKGSLTNIVMRKLWVNTPERTFVGVDNDFVSQNLQIKQAFLKAHKNNYLDAIAVFCNHAGCLTRIGDDRKSQITTYDYGHLTPIASDYLAKNLLRNAVINIEPQLINTTHEYSR